MIFWNKIIRKLVRTFTHKESEAKEKINKNLNSDNRSFIEKGKYYDISEKDFQYRLRKTGSDYDVFTQVVINQEYKPLVEYFNINKIKPYLIVDCGANIGLTSIQFAKEFPECQIIAIEPDKSNFDLLQNNLAAFQNVECLNRAIWSSLTTLKLDRNFRDGQEWSLRTVKDSENAYDEIATTTMKDLIKNYDISTIDLLKIDIEGAETELFKNEATCGFLDVVSCIAIEIHDECIDRELVYTLLKKKSFTLINSGELTIGFKKM